MTIENNRKILWRMKVHCPNQRVTVFFRALYIDLLLMYYVYIVTVVDQAAVLTVLLLQNHSQIIRVSTSW